jgi:tRNA-binding EMAP/Myf-like protein
VAAKVLGVTKHPNADRLRVIKLSVGDRVIDPVVCGAFNFEAGDVVALALPGAKISQNVHSETHEPFVLGKAKIRGVESQGMICSAFELGLSQFSEKPEIMILRSATKPGSPFEPGMIK